MLNLKDIEEVIETFSEIRSLFPKNEDSKNLFLAVCRQVNSDCDIESIDIVEPFGGLIGPGNSRLHPYLKKYKILRLHAAFHDAYGFVKREFDLGPGYSYIIQDSPSHPLLGHVSGIAFWVFIKLFKQKLFFSLNV